MTSPARIPDFELGQRVRFVNQPGASGVIIDRGQYGFRGPWEYTVMMDAGYEVECFAEHIEPAPPRTKFEPRIVGGTDYAGDTLPSEMDP